MDVKERLCVVMPVYNEREAIADVIRKWHAELSRLGIDFTIRPYNDGSKDDSLGVMRAVAAGLDRVEVRDKPNGGHGHTILTGYREAAADGFDWVFQIDSDDEMGPEEFGELWSNRTDKDFLVGIRDGRKQALPRKIMSFVSRLCVRIFYGRTVWDVNTPYRLMRVSAFSEFFERIPLSTFAPNVILSGLAGATGMRLFEMRVPQHDRTTGEVSIKKWKLLKAAVKSFWQTIAFAVGMRAVGPEGFSLRVLRLLAIGGTMSGLALCALSIARVQLLILSAVLLSVVAFVAMIPTARKLGAFVMAGVERRPLAALALVFAAGMLVRVFAYIAIPELDRLQGGDCIAFWDWSKEMAAGCFPAAKSWTATGLWAVMITIFGDYFLAGACLNVVLQFVTAVLLFRLACDSVGNAAAGVFAAAAYWLSPLFAGFAFHMYSEHVYYLLVTMTVAALFRWRKTHSMAMAALVPTLVFAVLWTRGEGGLIFLGIVPFLYLCEVIAMPHKRRNTVFALVVFVSFSIVGIVSGIVVNERYHGAKTFLCSDDNWWPRLYGSNYECCGNIIRLHYKKDGKVRNKDKDLICARYEHDTGKRLRLAASTCPPELIPYIKAEIVKRWNGMSFLQKVKFVYNKERHTWAQWKHVGWRSPYGKIPSFILKVLLVLCAMNVFWQWCVGLMLDRRENPVCTVFFLVPALFCCGIAVVVAIAEAHPRYGAIAMSLVFPFYGAVWLGLHRRRRR